MWFYQGNFLYEKFCLKSFLLIYSIIHLVEFLRGFQMDKTNTEIYWLFIYLVINELLDKLTLIQ